MIKISALKVLIIPVCGRGSGNIAVLYLFHLKDARICVLFPRWLAGKKLREFRLFKLNHYKRLLLSYNF
jgi:hypothetical protein